MATETKEMIQIEKPPPPSVVAELSPIVKAAQAFEVRDVDTNRIALERVRELRAGENRIAEHFEPTRKHLDAAKKELLAFRDGLIGPIAAARSIYDSKASEYEAAERRKAEDEQRRLQAEARKQEEERALLAAIEAEESGDGAQAEAILAEPVSAPIIAVAPAVAKVAGVSSTTRWSAEIHDSECKDAGCTKPDHRFDGIVQLIRYVAANPEWLGLLETDRLIEEHPNLNRLAVSQRQALAIPGVRAVSRKVRATR